MIKSKRMRWVGHERCVNKILIGKLRHRQEDNNKMCLKK
jgi:hypothetical protein